MKILVVNIGSTSFKYRLFEMREGRPLASGSMERIGSPLGRSRMEILLPSGEAQHFDEEVEIPHQGKAIDRCLRDLTHLGGGCLGSLSELTAVGFKAVHGGRITGAQRVTPELLAAMEEAVPLAPAHNPPYIAAMRALQARFPQIPLVAAFETGFHADIPLANRLYAVPEEWIEGYQIRRFGFHGASHRYISQRLAELSGRTEGRWISCHLGGSSSLCAIRDGRSVATSMGGSPQGGLPQNNRVGDFDPYLLPHLMKQTGQTCEELLATLSTQGGLWGLSGGCSTDIRDLLAAAESGNAKARLALDVYVFDIRRYLGAYLVELGGAEGIVFTGGIGEHRPEIRRQVCRNLEELGIELDEAANELCHGTESCISRSSSRVRIYVIPTNEEWIVACQTRDCMQRHGVAGRIADDLEKR